MIIIIILMLPSDINALLSEGASQVKNTRKPHLNRGRTEGKQLITGPLCVSIHVDQNVDSILVNTISCLPIARNLMEETIIIHITQESFYM